MKTLLLAAIGLLAALAPAHADQTYNYADCTYTDLQTSPVVTIHGPCRLIATTVNGHFGFFMKWPQTPLVVTVEETAHQGQNRIWIINGRPGTAFEINREHVEGSTLDLKLTVGYRVNADSP